MISKAEELLRRNGTGISKSPKKRDLVKTRIVASDFKQKVWKHF